MGETTNLTLKEVRFLLDLLNGNKNNDEETKEKITHKLTSICNELEIPTNIIICSSVSAKTLELNKKIEFIRTLPKTYYSVLENNFDFSLLKTTVKGKTEMLMFINKDCKLPDLSGFNIEKIGLGFSSLNNFDFDKLEPMIQMKKILEDFYDVKQID